MRAPAATSNILSCVDCARSNIILCVNTKTKKLRKRSRENTMREFIRRSLSELAEFIRKSLSPLPISAPRPYLAQHHAPISFLFCTFRQHVGTSQAMCVVFQARESHVSGFPGEIESCLLVLDSVSSTPQCIHQPKPRGVRLSTILTPWRPSWFRLGLGRGWVRYGVEGRGFGPNEAMEAV